MMENQLERIAVALEKLCVLVAETPKGETKAPATREKKKKEKETPKPVETPGFVLEFAKPTTPGAITPETKIVDLVPSPVSVDATLNVNGGNIKETPVTAVETASKASANAITVEQLRAAIIEVQQKKGPAIAKKIVQEVGNAPQVTKIEVSKYQMVMDACKAALNGQ